MGAGGDVGHLSSWILILPLPCFVLDDDDDDDDDDNHDDDDDDDDEIK